MDKMTGTVVNDTIIELEKQLKNERLQATNEIAHLKYVISSSKAALVIMTVLVFCLATMIFFALAMMS